MIRTETFPGRFDSLEKIGEFVIEAAHAAGLDQAAIYAVQLAVDEACSNIIDHAYGGEGKGDIECSCDIQPDHLKIILRDKGKPFNPAHISSPKLNVPIEKLKPRGVGLYLMRKMMDEVHYETTPDQGNTWVMIKRKA
jgi:serine/threonine-protein kinase RsbW